jgi:hypothetical protein
VAAGEFPIGCAAPDLRQHGSVLENLEHPSAHRCLRACLDGIALQHRRGRAQIEASVSPGWLLYAENEVAPIRREAIPQHRSSVLRYRRRSRPSVGASLSMYMTEDMPKGWVKPAAKPTRESLGLALQSCAPSWPRPRANRARWKKAPG